MISILLIPKKTNNSGDKTQIEGNKNILDQLLSEAEERNDLEELCEKMPWLDITSARWKKVFINNSITFPPAPSDVHVTGILTLKDEYLDAIHAKYSWFDVNSSIPESLLTEDMKGYKFQMSQDYRESYLPMLKGYNVVIFIDFDKKIVHFVY